HSEPCRRASLTFLWCSEVLYTSSTWLQDSSDLPLSCWLGAWWESRSFAGCLRCCSPLLADGSPLARRLRFCSIQMYIRGFWWRFHCLSWRKSLCIIG